MRWESLLASLTLMVSASCVSKAVSQEPPASRLSASATELTRASALRMTTGQLARLLLPGQPESRFASHEVGRLGVHGEPLGVINFFHRPVPIGADLCRRDVTSALFQPAGAWEPGRDSPVRFTRASHRVQMAVAPACRFKAGGYFGWVQPEGVDELAPQALRRLAALQAVARGGGQLPKVDCASEIDPPACARPPQELIASLTLDRIYIIQADRSGWSFSVKPAGPGQPFWDVRIPPEGIADEPIVLRWGMPAPF